MPLLQSKFLARFVLWNGGKLETSEGYTCLFCYFLCGRIEIESSNKWSVAQYIADSWSVVSEYITRASPFWYIHLTTDRRARDICTKRLTNNQWYIGQQITVSRILFLKYNEAKERLVKLNRKPVRKRKDIIHIVMNETFKLLTKYSANVVIYEYLLWLFFAAEFCRGRRSYDISGAEYYYSCSQG